MDDDPYTMELELCGPDGVVDLAKLNRLRALGGHDPYDGPPLGCTGSAHLAGEHVRCSSAHHAAAPRMFCGGCGADVTTPPASGIYPCACGSTFRTSTPFLVDVAVPLRPAAFPAVYWTGVPVNGWQVATTALP